MKYGNLIILAFVVSALGCRQKATHDDNVATARTEFEEGNFNRIKDLADSLKGSGRTDTKALNTIDSLVEIASRIALDFRVGEKEVLAAIEKRFGPVTSQQVTEWEKAGWLEYRYINGEKKYFGRAVSNLALLKEFHEAKKKGKDLVKNGDIMTFRLEHAKSVLEASQKSHAPVLPVKMKINYTITVESGAVPGGELVRCWLPLPRTDQERQGNFTLLATSEKDYKISPDSLAHKTIYMEKAAIQGQPTEFRIEFSYESSAQYFNMKETVIKPYDNDSPVYRKYTSEQLPHICFTEDVKRMADSIAGGESDPAEVVRKIYMWFKDNIPWAGALEYSTMPEIPAYVLTNRRGDCGMQTFLFMSMLRYMGIPVRWQSGWMVPPGGENLHDWCEVYYEGVGWVPADVSYDLLPTGDPVLREFYLSGIDSYRMTINNGVAGRLYPEKRFMRSEPYDFQRGEVEWRGGNLYFDKWDYNIEIEYLYSHIEEQKAPV
jgi:hypothetical protein